MAVPAKGANESIGVIHATPTVVNGYVYFGTSTFPAFYKLKPNGHPSGHRFDPAAAHRPDQKRIGKLGGGAVG